MSIRVPIVPTCRSGVFLFSGYIQEVCGCFRRGFIWKQKADAAVTSISGFYNGTAQLPDRMVLKLSESYYLPEGLAAEPSLECSALMLNINLGHNRELMDNCRKLWEYAVFVECIRERLAAGEQLEEAVKQAVDICMKEGVLADILRTQRAEVEELMWAEFNEERFIAKEKEYSWEDGNKAGKVKGRAESILEILEELGTVPEELRRRLLEETDLQRLKNWLKEAIKAASIEDFAENMDK